jgi:hypothetical protein
MDATNTVGQFAAYAADEIGFYLDRRLQAQTWNSYGDERAWHRAATEYETQLAVFRAVAPAVRELSHGRRRTLALAALLTLGLALPAFI